MRVQRLELTVEEMKAVMLGNAQIVWLTYPKDTRVHRINYDKAKNVYLLTIHSKEFAEVDIVDYNYHNIPTERARMQAVPGIQIQINLFLQLMFPQLLQDYASIQSQIKDRTLDEQTQMMQGIYRMRINDYIKTITEMEMKAE